MAGSEDIWVIRRDGSDLRRLTPWPQSTEKKADWSPDGTRIVFASNFESSRFHLWLADSGSGHALRLTDPTDSYYDIDPRFSPDGHSVAFTSTRSGRRQIWLMNVDGSQSRRLVEVDFPASGPAWSPSGDRIAFTGCPNICSIYSVRLDGSDLQKLTNDEGEDYSPDWSTRGIVFSATRGGRRVWVIQENGAGLQPMAGSTGGSLFDARWDPAGTGIVATETGPGVLGETAIVAIETPTEPEVKIADSAGFSQVECGNHVTDLGESCDDGNAVNGDGCDSDCRFSPGNVCGNAAVSAEEQCDDGNLIDGDGCDSNCTITACGNGIRTTFEICDDGNTSNGDGCDGNCTPTACGNGVLTAGEACDDGNQQDGDGCDHTCKVTGCGNGVITGNEVCDDGNQQDGDGCDANCTATACGNGRVTAGEICDDGNDRDDDGCDGNCTVTACGNGRVTSGEFCDDGNAVDADGCDHNCKVTGCGNGVLTPGEVCDDGNLENGDGCDGNCTATACGNGVVSPGEECDDGNLVDGDGCESDCQYTPEPVNWASGLFVGLKNSDDQGTSFDLRTEVYKSGALVIAGQQLCVADVTRNPAQAKLVVVTLGSGLPVVPVAPGDVIALRFLTRIGTNPDGTKCPGHANAVGLRAYYGSTTRASGVLVNLSSQPGQPLFMRSTGNNLLLDPDFPDASTALSRDSSSIKFTGGNPWKEIGTWSRAEP